MRYTIKHTFNCDVDTFWNKIYADPEYHEKLFKDRLKFPVYKVLAYEPKPDGSFFRRIECEPPMEIPAIAKKFFGDSIGYFEAATFDPKTRKLHSDVQPKAGADKIQMKVAFWVEPRGPKQCERFVEVDSNVKIFGIGKVLEGMIEKETRQSYEVAATFTNKWIAEKAL